MGARTGKQFLAGLKSPPVGNLTWVIPRPEVVNHVRDLAAPFGGSRDSGIGREGGTWSFDFYCDVKNIVALKGSFA